MRISNLLLFTVLLCACTTSAPLATSSPSPEPSATPLAPTVTQTMTAPTSTVTASPRPTATATLPPAIQTIANGTWELVTVEPTPNTLLSADFAIADDGWAVGIYGQLLNRNGKSWAPFDGSRNMPHSLMAVKYLAPNDGWAVGGSGVILHWDGAEWNKEPSPTDYDLYALAFISPQLGWAVGGRPSDVALGVNPDRIILSWKGKTWEKVTCPTSYPLNWELVSIGISTAQDGWAVGHYSILHWDGKRWQEYKSAFNVDFQAVASFSPQDAWIVGEDYTTREGVILHWDGYQWTEHYRSKWGLRGIAMYYNEKYGYYEK